MNETIDLTQFEDFPKMGRFSREVVITEKIDGTNAQVCIDDSGSIRFGSRTRWITPENDNAGFARWAEGNKAELLKLGPGRHFGEWWGSGVQRGYGMKTKQFWLFNAGRWILSETDRVDAKQLIAPTCCGVVPIVRKGILTSQLVDEALNDLITNGSKAAPGFMDPEGIVIFHTAAGVGFKKTIKDDGVPKSLVGKS